MSSPLSSTPNSSSTIWASSTRSSESTSSSSKVGVARDLVRLGAELARPRRPSPRLLLRLLWLALVSPFVLRCSGGQAAVDGQRRSGHVGGLARRRGSARRRRPPRGCRPAGRGPASSEVRWSAPRSAPVSTQPGATAFTVIPRRATSTATVFVNADQARLGGRVVRLPGVGAGADDRGDVDDPPEAGAQHRRAAPGGSMRKAAERLVSITRSQSLVVELRRRGRRRACRRC